MRKANTTELKILELSARKNIGDMSFGEIAKEVGIKNSATARYYVLKLRGKGLLSNNSERKKVLTLYNNLKKAQKNTVTIPVLGLANCGPALAFAEEMISGSIKVSSSLLHTNRKDNLFAVEASGNSLNRANIDGKGVNSGDYLIVDTGVAPQNGDYVLSVVGGCANIKKYTHAGDKIILSSESTEEYEPIFIHPDDDYLVNGVVVQVIKKPLQD